ncbi:MAG: aminotransferase class I/II-fold pyridoxal phosphate-dependent enzyme [Pseudomonadota bacterium]
MITFKKSFTQQESIPDAGIDAAIEVLKSGRLHRYNVIDGEAGETALLENEFAAYMGMPYCLACASGGYAIHVALRSVGVKQGDKVLTNAFTLSPVPGAIHNSGGVAVLVESGDDYKIDLDDLRSVAASSGAKFLLLSHMRGHIADMDEVLDICKQHEIQLIEDCAHTMGARWNGKLSGTFGAVACFSTQTYKHINSGEGGLLVTHDSEIIKRSVVLSGSYMLYGKHQAAPDESDFTDTRWVTPNYSGRMDNLRAAILRPQLRELDVQCERWNERYNALADRLRKMPGVSIPTRPAAETFVGSSIQFSLPGFSDKSVVEFVEACAARGVVIKWFGCAEPHGYTSRHDSWRYMQQDRAMEQTTRVLSTLCDMRVPLTFSLEDCTTIADVVEDVLLRTRATSAA